MNNIMRMTRVDIEQIADLIEFHNSEVDQFINEYQLRMPELVGSTAAQYETPEQWIDALRYYAVVYFGMYPVVASRIEFDDYETHYADYCTPYEALSEEMSYGDNK